MFIMVTGPAGAGKSSFAKYFKSQYPEVVHLDLDDVMINTFLNRRNLTKRNNFGRSILQNWEGVNFLYNNLFLKKPKLMTTLFKVFHKNIDKLLEQNKNKLVILDSLFFPYMPKYYDVVDHAILVDADRDERIKRVLERDPKNKYESIKTRQELLDKVFENKSKYDIFINSTKKEDFDKTIKTMSEALWKEFQLKNKSETKNNSL